MLFMYSQFPHRDREDFIFNLNDPIIIIVFSGSSIFMYSTDLELELESGSGDVDVKLGLCLSDSGLELVMGSEIDVAFVSVRVSDGSVSC